MAQALHGWLQPVIQSAQPWMSEDIEKGSRWEAALQPQTESPPPGLTPAVKIRPCLDVSFRQLTG